MQLELLPGRREREHLVVELLERRAGAQQPQPASRRGRRGCRPGRRAARRRTAARRRRSCGPRRAARPDSRGTRSIGARAIQSSESSSAGSRGASEIARRIAWMRADLTFEIPPGRIASSTAGSGASRTCSQRRQALAQAQVGDVAVAVVGGLREDRQDQLGDRVVGAGPSAAPRRPRAGVRAPAAPGRGPGRLHSDGGTRALCSGRSGPRPHRIRRARAAISSPDARGGRTQRRDRRAPRLLAERRRSRAGTGGAAAVRARRAQQLRPVGRLPEADRGLRAGPARLRPLGQARLAELHDRRVRPLARALPGPRWAWSGSASWSTTGARWASRSPSAGPS